MIKFENVSVTYPGGVEALKDLDLEINQGDFIIIVGLSGACLLYTSPSPRDRTRSRMPSSA